jgi:4-coumarate--CoA ligase
MKNRGSYDEKLKVWSGPRKDPIHNTNVGLGYLILEVLKKTPEMVTQVSADTNVELTCHEMRQRTLKIASHLIRCGLKQGDVVGVMATNSENLAPVVFACLALGLPLNFLAPVMVETDIVQMYSNTKPKLIFCDANILTTVQNAVELMSLEAKIFTLVEKVEGFAFVDDLLASVDFDEGSFA